MSIIISVPFFISYGPNLISERVVYVIEKLTGLPPLKASLIQQDKYGRSVILS